MKKQVVITCLALALIGCQPYSREATKEYELPKALEHCTVHEISNGQLRELYVVLCPGKTTTATIKDGKYPTYISLIE